MANITDLPYPVGKETNMSFPDTNASILLLTVWASILFGETLNSGQTEDPLCYQPFWLSRMYIHATTISFISFRCL